MERIASFAFVALAMLSCTATPESEVAEPEPDTCGAEAAQVLVGQTVEDLASATFAAEVTRFINPGDVITQDIRPDRMNIQFGEDGAISRVYCG